MSPIVREYFRVPREDRATYFRPEPAALAALVARNRALLGSFAFPFADRPFREFRAQARTEVAALAQRYTASWGFAPAAWSEPAPLILTGHQPPPIHPGVWIKNFLAGRLAEAVGGAAIHLTVDNDEPHGRTLRFPTRGQPDVRLAGDPAGAARPVASAAPARRPEDEADEVRVAAVELAANGGTPFEEEPVGALRADAIHEVLAAVPSPAMAEAFRASWTHLVATVPSAANLGEALSMARRRQEEQVGLHNLELPVSALADGDSFLLFAAEMLRRREDLLAAYNDSLAEYRRAYRERSAAQPVPDLARRGPRMELPFWIWRRGQARRRLWCEAGAGGGLLLAAEGTPVGRLEADELRHADETAARLKAWREAGWKIRPRALSMTLFVRLAIGDVFIHGLGGALYDKTTDAMLERLFGVRPPELVVASSAVALPLERFPATARDLEAARRAVRDWKYNPDRMLPPEARKEPRVGELIDEKRLLVAQRGATCQERRRAFLRIRNLNDDLAIFAPDGPEAAWRRLAQVEREIRQNRILRDREYATWFYPAADLAAFYREALGI